MKAFGFLLENLGLEDLEGDDRMKVTKVGYNKCVGWQYFGKFPVRWTVRLNYYTRILVFERFFFFIPSFSLLFID